MSVSHLIDTNYNSRQNCALFKTQRVRFVPSHKERVFGISGSRESFRCFFFFFFVDVNATHEGFEIH